ncbi:MAG: L,D-transpeptidase [Magnetococcales bacterium]|nr:L,D-transpeptidase [Magnetococcales bacterium]
MTLLRVVLAVFFAVFALSPVLEVLGVETGGSDKIERLLVQSLDLIGQNRLREAEIEIRTLVAQQPDFRLAQAVLGDLYSAKAGSLTRFGAGIVNNDKEVADLLAEAKARLAREHPPEQDYLPGELLRLPSRYHHALLVDLSRSRLYLFQNLESVPDKLADFYITIGKEGGGKELQGDKKTPIGLYHITGRLGGKTLPPFYGAGALPLDYPNPWDQLNHRTGKGIWLHGTPMDTYSRPPRASDGCIVLTNPDFKTLDRTMTVDDPVIVTEHIDWLSPDEWWHRRELLLQRIELWRADLIRLQGEDILRHYSKDYKTGHLDDVFWNHLEEGGVELMDPAVLSYPGAEKMMVILWGGKPVPGAAGRGFTITQFWRFENRSDWKIIFEPNG